MYLLLKYSSNVFFATQIDFMYPLGGFLLCNEIKSSFQTDTDDAMSMLVFTVFLADFERFSLFFEKVQFLYLKQT